MAALKNALLYFILSTCLMPVIGIQAMPAQVIIIRHGEKDPVTFELTQQGFERAGALAHYFTQTDDLLLFGPPFAIFASRPVHNSDDFTVRCIDTVVPTAALLNLPVHSPYGPLENQLFADFILNNKNYDGKNILICWHHTAILRLIEAFGYLPPTVINPVYPNRYDLTFIMTFPAPFPPVQAEVQCQSLMRCDGPPCIPGFTCPP